MRPNDTAGDATPDHDPGAPADRPRVTRYAFVFTLVLASGFFNLAAAASSPFSKLNLLLHPALGVLATATIIATLFRRIRAEVPAFGPLHLASFVLMSFVALVRSFTLAHLPEMASNILTALLSPLLVACALYFFVRTVPLLAAFARAKSGWSHLALISLWLLALLVGVLLGSSALAGRVPPWMFAFHSALGYAAAGVGAWVLLRPAWRRLRRSGLLAGVAAGLALLAACAVIVDEGARVLDRRPELAPLTVHLSVVPSARRHAGDRDALPFPVDASWLEITESCLGSGCHAELEDGFRHALHNVSYRTPHMHKVLELVARELGPGEQAMCAGCHVPGSLLAGGPSADAYRTRTNMPCVFCHSVSGAEVDDHERSHYTITLRSAALAGFRAAEARGQRLPGWERAAIQLNTSAHAKVFAPPILRQDAFCLSCHHTQILPEGLASAGTASPADAGDGAALACIDCHLPPTRTLGVENARRGHFFPGSNATVPALLGFDDYARFTDTWMQSGFLLRTFENLYHKRDAVRRVGEERKDAFFYAEMSSSFEAPPRAGDLATLTVRTRNLGMGHPFPASSLGLAEAWLEVRVTDGAGREVFSSGGLDAERRVTPGTHTLGGRLLDAEGQPIDRYRVWAAAHEIIDRQIPYRGEITDPFTLAVPADADRHLNVAASWRYRKLGQAFWDWAYSPDQPIPSSEVVRCFAQFPLAASDGSASVAPITGLGSPPPT